PSVAREPLAAANKQTSPKIEGAAGASDDAAANVELGGPARSRNVIQRHINPAGAVSHDKLTSYPGAARCVRMAWLTLAETAESFDDSAKRVRRTGAVVEQNDRVA